MARSRQVRTTLAKPPAYRPTASTEARELRHAAAVAEGERRWRRQVRRVIAACFAAQGLATGVGLAGFAVDDVALGRTLLSIGQAGVVLFPAVIVALWTVEAHRRGDL